MVFFTGYHSAFAVHLGGDASFHFYEKRHGWRATVLSTMKNLNNLIKQAIEERCILLYDLKRLSHHTAREKAALHHRETRVGRKHW